MNSDRERELYFHNGSAPGPIRPAHRDSPTIYERLLPPELADIHFAYKPLLARWVDRKPDRFLWEYQDYREHWRAACESLYKPEHWLDIARRVPFVPPNAFWRMHKHDGIWILRDVYAPFWYFWSPRAKRIIHYSEEAELIRREREAEQSGIAYLQRYGLRLKHEHTRHGTRKQYREGLAKQRDKFEKLFNPREIFEPGPGKCSWSEPTEKQPEGAAWLSTIRRQYPRECDAVIERIKRRKKQWKVFRCYYMDDLLQPEIVIKFHMSKGGVSDMLARCRSYFREAGIPEPKHIRDGREGIRIGG